MTREDLYELVWSLPSSTAAGRLGISDVYLGRVCKMLDVPKPPPGYWRKCAVGRAPPRPGLTDVRPGMPRVWSKGNATIQPPASRAIPSPEAIERIPARNRRVPHKLVQETSIFLKSADTAENEYLRPRKKLVLDILCTKDGLGRCLRFTSDLFHALEIRGHYPAIAPAFDQLIRANIRTSNTSVEMDGCPAWSPLRPTVVYVYGVPIGLSIVETSELRKLWYVGEGRFVPEKEYRADRYPGPAWKVERLRPTGKIKLVAYSPFNDFPWMQEWDELEGASLLKEVDNMVLAMEAKALTLSAELERAGRYF